MEVCSVGDSTATNPPADGAGAGTIVIEQVKDTVGLYYPQLVKSVMAELAIFGAMSLADRRKPVSLIFEGSSGLERPQ